MALGIEIEFSALDAASLFPADQLSHATGRCVRVAIERGIDRLDADDQGLLYSDPWGDLAAGELVEVPLGKASKPVRGVVIAGGDWETALAGASPERLAKVHARAKAVLTRHHAAIPRLLIDLARWISTYYVCPLGMTLMAMTPAAVKKRIGGRTVTVFDRTTPEPTQPPPRLAEIWERIRGIDATQFPMTPAALVTAAGLTSKRGLAALRDLGLLRERRIEIVRRFGEEATNSDSDFEASPGAGAAPAVTLTAEQAHVVDGIAAGLGSFRVHMLRGVTGSGKTEVYLRLIAQVLARGGRAIVLVPEIALTPQTSARFIHRFGRSAVVVLHSGLTPSQRHAAWSCLARGEARVVVGARSAVFAPLTDVGIIIVDEEHDSSYKQDQLPRYHARSVAIKRAQLEGCPVILGSATPSLETYANAGGDPAIPARFTPWELPRRATGSLLPDVQIVDMRLERRILAARGIFAQRIIGPTLADAIHRALEDDVQIMLLLNRRGFSHQLCCSDTVCGFMLTCAQCDASLVWHKGSHLPNGSFVRCHYCLQEQKLATLCPVCGRKLIALGIGTQRAEDEIENLFAAHGIKRQESMLRLDSDSMGSARDYFRALDRFAKREVRILLGTQMIAKGLDFPGVGLVGVLDADTAASWPDFRAAERTFQMISQVAGRAGRGDIPGRVYVQTFRPDTQAVVMASAHDYPGFAAEELAARRQFGLPPARRMVRIVSRDLDHAKGLATATELAEELCAAAAGSGGLDVTGPSECVISRIAAYYRFEVIGIADNSHVIQAALAALRARGRLISDSRTAVDVDPVSMM